MPSSPRVPESMQLHHLQTVILPESLPNMIKQAGNSINGVLMQMHHRGVKGLVQARVSVSLQHAEETGLVESVVQYQPATKEDNLIALIICERAAAQLSSRGVQGGTARADVPAQVG